MKIHIIQLAFWKFNLRFVDFHGYTKMHMRFHQKSAFSCINNDGGGIEMTSFFAWYGWASLQTRYALDL